MKIKKFESTFTVKAPNSISFKTFNVLTPGQIRVELSWRNPKARLTVALHGKHRPELKKPTAPYATVSGFSPLRLEYEVTKKDVARGVSWRLVVSGEDEPVEVEGTVTLATPYNEDLSRIFQREKVTMRSGDLWPNTTLKSNFETRLSNTPKDRLHGIITLKRPVNCVEALQLKKLGIVRQSFLAGKNSFGFVRKGTDLNNPLITSLVSGVTPLDPEDRVDPHIWLGNLDRFIVTDQYGQIKNYVLDENGNLTLSVLFANDVPVNRIQEILNTNALKFTAITDSLWKCTIKPAHLKPLAAFDEVEWIEAGPVPHLPTLDRTRQTINADVVQDPTINAAAGTINYAGFTGAGVTVGVDDTGVDPTHPDLNVVADLAGVHYHGHHVAGIIAASGVQSDKTDVNGNPNMGAPFQWRGVAPEAAIIDSSDLITTGNLLDAIQNHSLDLSNHSHTLGLDGDYNSQNRTVDQEIRGGAFSAGTQLPQRPQIYASANNGDHAQYGNVVGYFSNLNQTKNAIVCGAWNAFNNRLAGFSSMGPSHDGRIKPDVIAPGVNVTSTGTRDNEIQALRFQLVNNIAPTQGTFTLNFNGQVTGNIPFNASAATVRTSLEALNNVNPGDINTWGGPLPGDSIGIQFTGQFAFTNVANLITVDTGINNGATTQIIVPLTGHDDRNGYVVHGGTSMAAPAVSGVVALLMEAWQTTYNIPAGATLDTNQPLPSTWRALLIQTAIDIVNNDVRGAICADVDFDSTQGNGNDDQGFATATVGPDFATGWGLVDAAAAVNMLLERRTVNNTLIPNRIIQDAINQGGIKEYDFVVDQAGDLRVTLAWDDVEGAIQSPATSPMLINDLDLELEAPNGTIHYPWQLGHTIQDANGIPLADNAQPPGTQIQVAIPISPNANPANNEYIPANALTGNGDWVARTGKDHLNNVEQVFVNVPANQIGHWILRVLGFDVKSGVQKYSVVGFPYPDLAEIEVACTAKVALPALNSPIVFNWTAENSGALPTGGAGATFDYQVWLSRNFILDNTAVALADANQAPLGPLAVGASVQHNSSVQITQANADALLGPGTTIQQLQEADVFLIVQADSNDVVLEHRETNTAVVQLARPVDVVLVMDRSGSMSGTVPVSNGTKTKMQILQDSANLFLDLMRRGAGDQLAEVSFSSPAHIDTIFGPGGLTVFTTGNLGQAKAAINAMQPATSTDIRGGLQRGLDVMTAGSVAGHRKVLIFFSDGKKTAGLDPTETAFLQQFDSQHADVHVYSVGFGTKGGTEMTGIDVDLLETLANANTGQPGFFHVTESAVALDKFFVNAVAGAIDGQVVVDPEDDIPAGAVRSLNVSLSRQDYAATFVLTWDDPVSKLDLMVRSPSGFEFNAGNAGIFGNQVSFKTAQSYKLMTIQLPITTGPNVDHVGHWQLVVKNPGNNSVHYSTSVISESTIRAELTPPKAPSGGKFKIGDKIPLLVTLRQLGRAPLPGANVTVTPNVPRTDLTSLLASAGITKEELAAVPREIKGDVLSQTERMYLALVKRMQGKDPLARADLPPITLGEDREPGEYLGTFVETRIPGVYTFVVHIEGITPECEPFQRELSFSVVVAPDPEREKGKKIYPIKQ